MKVTRTISQPKIPDFPFIAITKNEDIILIHDFAHPQLSKKNYTYTIIQKTKNSRVIEANKTHGQIAVEYFKPYQGTLVLENTYSEVK